MFPWAMPVQGMGDLAGLSLLRPQQRTLGDHPFFLAPPAKLPTNRMGLSVVKGNKSGQKVIEGGGQRFYWAPAGKQAWAPSVLEREEAPIPTWGRLGLSLLPASFLPSSPPPPPPNAVMKNSC